MLKCCSLYSGSTGNSFFVQTEDTKLLVDCGVSCKKIENALSSLNVLPENINGILLTHEHIDHTKSVGLLSKKYGIPIFANIVVNEVATAAKIRKHGIVYYKIILTLKKLILISLKIIHLLN